MWVSFLFLFSQSSPYSHSMVQKACLTLLKSGLHLFLFLAAEKAKLWIFWGTRGLPVRNFGFSSPIGALGKTAVHADISSLFFSSFTPSEPIVLPFLCSVLFCLAASWIVFARGEIATGLNLARQTGLLGVSHHLFSEGLAILWAVGRGVCSLGEAVPGTCGSRTGTFGSCTAGRAASQPPCLGRSCQKWDGSSPGPGGFVRQLDLMCGFPCTVGKHLCYNL